MLHKMQEKAPEEISGDLDDAVKVGRPSRPPVTLRPTRWGVGVDVHGVDDGLGPMNNVDAYTQQHCGRTAAMAAPAAAGTGSDTSRLAAEDSPTAELTPVIPDGFGRTGDERGHHCQSVATP
jgi:hypothetical protein